jgi:mono/diheme cytochrome c family protein
MRFRIQYVLVLMAAGVTAGLGYWALHKQLSFVVLPSTEIGPNEEEGSGFLEPPHAAALYARDVAPLLTRYCIACHAGETTHGGVTLDDLNAKTPLQAVDLWKRITKAVSSGHMPPQGQPGPSRAERDALVAWFHAATYESECSKPSPPARVSLRRLNRAEYNNTVRELLGVTCRPADDFPADDLAYGFDTIADVLTLAPLLLERYLDAAERVVDEAAKAPALWSKIKNPSPHDLVPFVLRGVPPDRERAVKNARSPQLDGGDPEAEALDRAGRVLQAFADRAYRRPIAHHELARLVRFLESAWANGNSHDEGIKLALQAILVSPHFLFRVEAGQVSEGAPGLSDFELATRLSYFLWSSTPDDELFQLACLEKLNRPGTLEKQVRRMLRDARAAALAKNFGPQWLQTRRLKEFTPDPTKYPHFDEALRAAMEQETERMFDHVVREDRSVLDFLSADYTFVNERLARHYGLVGIQGLDFRKVSLAGTGRGGVLTHASVLAVTSNPTRTSAVQRGKWILENLLGSPPPPPPPGVDSFGEIANASGGGTLRMRLDRHRRDTACASCHAAMDPLGLGLENFDAVGAWRTHDQDFPVDASGQLPDGRTFHGPEGLRALLVERKSDFTRCLAEKMLVYALGRGLLPADRCAVDRIVLRMSANDYRFSSLVSSIVLSDPFCLPASKGKNQ